MYLLRVAGVLVLLALLVRFYAVEAFLIVSDSMAPTLTAGDYLLVEKLSYRFGKPRRFDVVVVRVDDRGYLTKRLVGLPGEGVEIRDRTVRVGGRPVPFEPWVTDRARYLGHWDTGLLRVPEKGDRLAFVEGEPYLNGRKACGCEGVEVSFYERLLPEGMLAGEGQTFHVLEDYYFVLGDNRGNSRDSRFLGFVGRPQLRGRVWFVYWSRRHGEVWPRLERMGPFRHWRRGAGSGGRSGSGVDRLELR